MEEPFYFSVDGDDKDKNGWLLSIGSARATLRECLHESGQEGFVEAIQHITAAFRRGKVALGLFRQVLELAGARWSESENACNRQANPDGAMGEQERHG